MHNSYVHLLHKTLQLYIISTYSIYLDLLKLQGL